MKINPVLLVVDMQNGFCSKGGSFDKFGFNIKPYRAIIPNIRRMIDYMRGKGVPIYYSKAIREASGIDLIDKVHKIIPESRRERLEKMHLCIRDTWDSDIVDELKPEPEDYIVEKRRDSVFQDTEFELWLKALRADTIVFTGIDTYICVESTVRDAFNKGYDVILLKDCVASRNQKHHENTLEQIAEAYGLVLSSNELISMIENEELKLCFECK
ncbi:MAG: peroxyureidoacrylate/ureidoacrylate amidohydrolase RutB [Deltaproteobacteria bacterium]|mgnify:CR=1 FL=1|jgi:ureidoacrylate peracid hydrolase|nr:MAG: peroxyureidoacrylate/ureidoacrylate amidohydrolase RutB [Deltaproteobacteria bacterium]